MVECIGKNITLPSVTVSFCDIWQKMEVIYDSWKSGGFLTAMSNSALKAGRNGNITSVAYLWVHRSEVCIPYALLYSHCLTSNRILGKGEPLKTWSVVPATMCVELDRKSAKWLYAFLIWCWATTDSTSNYLCESWIATGRKLGQYTGDLVYVYVATIAAANELQQLHKECSE